MNRKHQPTKHKQLKQRARDLIVNAKKTFVRSLAKAVRSQFVYIKTKEEWSGLQRGSLVLRVHKEINKPRKDYTRKTKWFT